MEKLIPEFTTEQKLMFNVVAKIENPFIQSIVDLGAIVFLDRNGFTIMGYQSMAYVFLHENNIVTLECISTPANVRKQGSGTLLLTLLVKKAKETNTKIVLRATNVTNSKMFFMPPMPIAQGSVTKNKIPVKLLPNWYKKFGFVEVSKDKEGVHMELV